MAQETASIVSRDQDSNLACLVVVLFKFFIRFIWKNERSGVQFVTIIVKNMRKLISTFGKAHSVLSSTIILFSMTVSSFFSFCCTTLMSKIWVKLLNYCSSHLDKHQLDFDNALSIVIFLLASVKDEVAFSGTSIRLFLVCFLA